MSHPFRPGRQVKPAGSPLRKTINYLTKRYEIY